MSRIDLAGQRFGRLVALSYVDTLSRWRCVCACGKEAVVATGHLRSGTTRSCGCLARELPRKRTESIAGRKFGRLLAVRFSHTVRGQAYWLCTCECGAECTVRGGALRSGKSRSCGCYRDELSAKRAWRINYRHGHSPASAGVSPTYRSWSSMHGRCNAVEGQPLFQYYAGRGIAVCERWGSFEAFLQDMGERPAGTTIDRIDNDRGYEPGNCRWATRAEQLLNRRPRSEWPSTIRKKAATK